jgi:hypothetical protein
MRVPILLAVGLATACAQAPPPASPPKSDPVAATSPQEAEDSPASTAAPQRREGSVIVIDPGTEAGEETRSLVEIARAERERRATAGRPVAVITNKTLPKSSGKGTAPVPQPVVAPAPAPEAGLEAAKGEEYWRSRGRAIRERWRQALTEAERLEQRIVDLRRRFYAEADPHRRDAQIKPEWDRALEQLEQARTEAEVARLELDAFLEEGRRSGALPGWLREGAEDEPQPKETPPPATESAEPREYRQGAEGPP